MIAPMRTAAMTALFTLALAAPAPAGDNGEGLVGETDDRIITFFSLGVVAFFIFVVIIGSVIQGRLEKRKEQRKAVDLRRSVGW
jgi:hypothetical protein